MGSSAASAKATRSTASTSDLDLPAATSAEAYEQRFDRANMRKCRLCGCRSQRASLEGADLPRRHDDAILDRTNLVSAKLTGATLRRAFLTDANLTTADARAQCSSGRAAAIFARARLDGAARSAHVCTAPTSPRRRSTRFLRKRQLPELKGTS